MNASLRFRAGCAAVLFHSGALRLLEGSPRPGAAWVLGYHHVLDAAEAAAGAVQPGMYVTPETFDRQMEYVSARYEMVPLSRLADGPPAGRACAVTFDDGWQDNYRHAFPILKRRRIPATIFLATGLIGTRRRLWPERISRLARLPVESDSPFWSALLRMAPPPATDLVPLRGMPPSDRAEFLIARIKPLPACAIARLEEALDAMDPPDGCGDPADRPWLDWREVREMSAAGVSFGAHSHTHTILTRSDPGAARREIALSRAALERETGQPPVCFSYPNGEHDAAVRAMVGESGFRIGVTTRSGSVVRGADPLALPRILIHEDISRTRPLFALRLVLGGRNPR